MAAALLQYQACLGIMMRLQVEDLSLLKRDFDRLGRGLSLEEFVSVMLDQVSCWDVDTVIPFIEDLVELFAQVDVNGDGTMEWEEFTSAIIEGGMGNNSEEMDWRDMQYEEITRFLDVTSNRPPKRIQYIAEFKRLLLHDNTRPVVEIIDPTNLVPADGEDGLTAHGGTGSIRTKAPEQQPDVESGGNSGVLGSPSLTLVNKFHPLCYIAGYRRDQDDVRSERSPVQALKYLNKLDLLAVSGGDLKLTFWSTTILTANSTSALDMPSPLAVVHTQRPQRVLEWNAPTQHLFSISADLLISVWLVVREKLHDTKGRCDVSLVTTLKKHTDLLQDLLVLNSETLLSCGMDSKIYLWDTQSLQVKAVRQGHRRGVRLLTKLSNQLFLSSGFECEVYGWDISALATTPVFKLWGHSAPVCCIHLITSAAFAGLHSSSSSSSSTLAANSTAMAEAMLADQVITVDDDGWFKWWNLANILSIENNDLGKSNNRCLQTFRIGSEKYPWKAHSLVVLNNGQFILAAGLHKLKLLHRVRLKPKVLASCVVLYNSVSFTLLTTTDREIRIWDAASGALLRTYRNITTSDITCVDLDARQRKIVFGTQNGELIVLNYLNGAILKHWTPHQLKVSVLIYCKEDQCVLTASWDRSLRLYDDNADTNALLRCITDAHEADIKCLAYCYALGIFASGSTDGSIKIWDYIYFLLEDTCIANASDVNVLEFVEPYPLLLSGHENGMVCVWNVAPTEVSTLLLRFLPFQVAPSFGVLDESNPAECATFISGDGQSSDNLAISCCKIFYDEEGGELMASDIRRGRFLLFSSNAHGDIAVSDISQLITRTNVRAFREESLVRDRSYNPRRKFIRHGKNAKRLKSKHHTHLHGSRNGSTNQQLHQNIEVSDVKCLRKWRAHHGNVRYLQIVDDPQAILTCGSDKTVKFWDFTGQALGTLGKRGGGQSKTAQADTTESDESVNTWRWMIDMDSIAAAKRRQAEDIWNLMKAEKIKSLAWKRQNILGAKRQRRRGIMSLRASTSAPALGISPEQIDQLAKMDRDGMPTEQEEPQADEQRKVPSEETNRLFQQLQGKATWKQSDFQLAREGAWEKETKKLQQRMKKIMKTKANGLISSHAHNNSNSEHPEGDSSTSIDIALSSRSLSDHCHAADEDGDLLPVLENRSQVLPFEDKDNWSVGSLNREKQMYAHLHQENVRRNQKQLASNGLRLRRTGSSKQIDLSPSAFLLEKLGASCIIQENQHMLQPLKQKTKKEALGGRQTRSMSVLPLSNNAPTTPSTSRNYSSEQTRNGESQKSDAVASSVVQHSIQELFQHYDQLLTQQQKEEEDIKRASQLLSEEVSLPDHDDGDSTIALSSQEGEPTKISKRKMSLSKNTLIPAQSTAKKPIRKGSIETLLEKKQRIRSDAAILRQERFGQYSRDDIVNIYRTFHKIDQDNSGSITLRELIDGAGMFAGTHLQDNIMSIFSSIDQDKSGHIDLPELCRAVFPDASPQVLQDILRLCNLLESAERAKKASKKKLTREQVRELEELFKLYDVDRNGDIDVDELFTALRYNEKYYDSSYRDTTQVTRDDIKRIIARFDANTNSTLDLNEFIELFRDDGMLK